MLASTSTVPLKPWTWIINERDRLSNRTPAARSNNGDENALFPRSAANCVAEELLHHVVHRFAKRFDDVNFRPELQFFEMRAPLLDIG